MINDNTPVVDVTVTIKDAHVIHDALRIATRLIAMDVERAEKWAEGQPTSYPSVMYEMAADTLEQLAALIEAAAKKDAAC